MTIIIRFEMQETRGHEYYHDCLLLRLRMRRDDYHLI